jgi:hypothetical protein
VKKLLAGRKWCNCAAARKWNGSEMGPDETWRQSLTGLTGLERAVALRTGPVTSCEGDMPHRLCVRCRYQVAMRLERRSLKYTTIGHKVNEIGGVQVVG